MFSKEDLAKRRADLSDTKRAMLAKRLGGQLSARSSGQTIQPVPRDQPLPLSFSQQRLWFLDHLEAGNPSYHIPTVVRLSGTLDQAALQWSLEQVVARHEVLRTCFLRRPDDGQPIQQIAPTLTLPLTAHDLRATPHDAPAVAQRLARLPFDLGHGPLLRADLLLLDPEEHWLVLTLHHSIADGWSLGVLLREVATLYAARRSGLTRSNGLPPLPVQYADYAVWQRQWLSSPAATRQLHYWKNQLADAPTVLELPTDRVRPAVQTFNGAIYITQIAPALTGELVALSQHENVTLFVTLLAAFDVLLYRYTQQHDILVGTPIAGRRYVELEGLIGLFVNTLALRARIDEHHSFRELLRQLDRTIQEAYEYQDLPLDQVVEAIKPDRDLSRPPLVQVLFALQNAPIPTVEVPGLRFSPVQIDPGVAQFDLLLEVHQIDDGLRATFTYNTDLFDEVTVARIAGHWQAILGSIVVSPDQPLVQMSLLGEAERDELLVKWNATATAYPREQSIHALFAAQVARTPDAPAVHFDAHHLTYRALDQRANLLAHHLQRRGVGPDTCVALCLDRSLDLVVALLAILKAGGAYVPLDPAYPPARLQFMLDDAQAVLLVTQRHLRSVLPPAPVLLLDDVDFSTATEVAPPAVVVHPDNLAYVMYTSGSTGQPKGVSVTHRNVVRLVTETTYARLAADEVFFQFAPVSFDAATFELWAPLLSGAQLVVCPLPQPSLAELGDLLHRSGVTTLWLTAGLFQQMVEHQLPALRGLRQLLAGGDVLSAPHVRQVIAQLPDCRLINGYGPTESTTFACCHSVTLADTHDAAIPIGRPIANTQVYVLDAHMRPVPVGVPGELFIGGDGLARGYHRQAALTAQRFLPDPFAAQPGARLYRTGDRVRWRPDGTLDFLGRLDQQVKLRGFRIELGELEAVLSQHPQVQAAVALVRDRAQGDKQLVAYVAAEPTLEEATLREWLRTRVPDYLLPAALVRLDALPLTPNGKLDRAALPAPTATLPARGPLAATALERLLAALWAELLDHDPATLPVTANFFELGGHSLLATQVVSQIRVLLQIELPLKRFFESPTIVELAAAITEQVVNPDRLEYVAQQVLELSSRADGTLDLTRTDEQRAELETLLDQAGLSHDPAYRITRRATDQPAPLALAQQRLWFLYEMDPHSPAYNISAAVHLRGALDLDALERSFVLLTERHEALRTTFTQIDGQSAQQIGAVQALPIPVVDLCDTPRSAQQDSIQQQAVDAAQQPFDLQRGPLLRLKLLRLAAEEHVLVLVMHHIISDAWSIGIMIRELVALYTVCAADPDASSGRATLPALPIQYADFAAWQRQYLQGAVLEQQISYWKAQLADAPVLELPTDYARPARQSFHGARQFFLVDQTTTSAIQRLAHTEDATLFMALLAAFNVLLGQYSGQNDLLVGTPIAGRSRAEIEHLVGFFVNTLVLRTSLDGQPNFREVLHRVREVATAAYAHQDVPFEKLVEELRPERDMARTPFFQVMFALQQPLEPPAQLGPLTIEPIIFDSGIAQFDLLVDLWETEQGLQGSFTYNVDLFRPESIARMMAQFQMVLASCASLPDTRLSQMSLLGEAERDELLVEWNATTTAYPRNQSIHALFAAQVARTPDAPAVHFGPHHLTYRALDQRANHLAHHLQRRGVGPDTCVALCLDRSLDLVVALLAILKAGGAYVPLDPAYPPARLQFMLDDAQAVLLVTQRHLRSALPPAPVLLLDDVDFSAADIDIAPPAVVVHPDNLAYVMYTSGSTGQPKGVSVTHRNVVRLVTETTYARLAADEVFFQFAPVSFDAATFELWAPLLTGAQLVVCPLPQPSLAELGDLLHRSGVTTLWLTAGLFQQMVEHQLPALRGLRQLLAGGDVLSVPHVRQVIAQLPDCRLINGYGPTESTTFACCHPVTLADTHDAAIPIGRPIANTQVYVLDAHMRPVPVGVPGELFIGGDGLARGYHRQAALTAQRFLPDPFAAQPGARLYRTGDRVRWRPDGTLDFLGRLDQQVKLRGFRIELGELEAVLSQHPQVQAAVALVRDRAQGDKQLVAYVAAEPTLEEATLREWLRTRVPDYLLPAALVRLAALPLTPNGKLDRAALPAPTATLPARGPLAATALERLLAALWAELLDHDPATLPVTANFFELGGHSLLATQVVTRIQDTLKVRLPLRMIFESPTIIELAAAITELQPDDSVESLPPIQPVPRDQPLPLSFAQQRFWFLDQFTAGSGSYLVPIVVRLSGTLDQAALQWSLEQVVARHEVLRTCFQRRPDDGQPIQQIAPTLTLPLTAHDLRAAPHDAPAVAQRLARLPFDLSRSPLLRADLLVLHPEEHWLVLMFHHSIADGWSMGVLLGEVATLYAARRSGLTSNSLPSLPVQYADYAVWQRQWLSSPAATRQLHYWQQQLANVPTLELPTDRLRPAVQTFNGALYTTQIAPALTDELVALSQREGVTLFMTLLAAFDVLLYRYTDQTDITIGSPIAGRSRVELEPLIGCFINTLALRVDLSDTPTFRELLQRVSRVTLTAYEHQIMPFDRIVDALDLARDLSRPPIVQVLFTLQNAPLPTIELPELQLSPLIVDTLTAKFDLSLGVVEQSEGMQVTLEYNTDLFDASTIERMAGHWQSLLEAVVADPQQRITRLPMLTPAERNLLLHGSNASLAAYPVSACLHEMVTAQALRQPDAVAVVYDEQRLTYQELNQRANQLAHYLQAQGIGPDECVAVCLDRSLELIVALLAILKAGGAYVPIDPAYPPERRRFMIQDTRARVLLTEQAVDTSVELPNVQILDLKAEWGRITGYSSAEPVACVRPDHAAYVIYTSGSTGQPKGVLIPHANVVRLFAATQEWFHFDERDVWTMFHSSAFDFSVWEIWGALIYGGRLVVVPYLTSRTPTAFYELLQRERVTVLNQTPSAFRQLIRAEAEQTASLDLALRLVIFGGEALELQSLAPWFERHGDQQPLLVNMYGITETTVHVTYRPLSAADVQMANGSVIGGAIPDLQMYVLDPQMQPVPVGVAGELYVGGAGLARGYLDRPALTATRFVPHPWSSERGARLYRTGDLARYRADGDMEYLGRIDQQVKIRGFRIELGEIETAISQHPLVREVVVAAQAVPGTADRRLVAYLTAKQTAPTVSELRTMLQTRLPEYMIPAAFVVLDMFPLTANGKLDRKALPEAERAPLDAGTTFVAPRTAHEQVLASIWASVLGVQQVGVHDNFFSLGGDSIQSIQVIALAREQGLHLSLQHIFKHQTIAQLAEVVDTEDGSLTSSTETQPFALVAEADRLRLPIEVEDAYPLTILQAGMLFHSQMEPTSAVYHDIFSFHLRAPFDQRALEEALQTTAARHAVLRTAFDLAQYNEPLQLVYRDAPLPLAVEDIQMLSLDEQEAALAAWTASEKHRPFDWTRAPLLRVFVHQRTAETFQFAVSFHHAILDGWSLATLLTEIFEYYQQLLGHPTGRLLPAPSVTFRDFVALEGQALASSEHDTFWRQRLRDYSRTALPRAFWLDQQPLEPQQQPLPSQIGLGLRSLAETAGVPLKSVLLAAHLRVLQLLSGQTDVLTGLVANGRPETIDGERAIGLFLNTLPFRLQLERGTWIDLVRATFAAEQDMLPFRRYPLARIQQNMGGQVLFETAFNFVHFHVYRQVLNSDALQIVDSPSFSFEQTNFTLTANFQADPASDALYLILDHDPAVLSAAQIQTIRGYYLRTLAVMAGEPHERHDRFDVLAAEERRTLLDLWSATAREESQPELAHRLFEAQARRTPEAPALIFGETILSYAQLDARSNQLASYLRRLGVHEQGEVHVGLCLERSPDLVIALLAVLKAGGAYLPLDPTYPLSRLAYMLDDAQVTVLLSHTHLLDRLPDHPAHVICVDVERAAIEAMPSTALASSISADHLAYMIYTSGSTGRPKGTLVTHRGLSNLAAAQIHGFDVHADSRILQWASPSFDASVSEVCMALLAGAMLVLASQAELQPGPDLLRLLGEQQITTVTLPPSVLAMLPDDGLPELRTVISAGEACPAAVVERWAHGRRFINAYGPTETTVCATLGPCVPDGQRPSIGRPIANMEVYILDSALEPAPVGVPGELYIGGIGLARGYHRQPALTAERFIPNPFNATSSAPGTRLYRTGDLASYRPDGTIDYLGRIDQQIKLRGFRIEVDEIAAVLREHPALIEAAVVARTGVADEQQLVAYIVAMPEAAPSSNEIRTYLAERLPSYMLPAVVVPLDTLPLSPNGKLDRAALPSPDQPSARSAPLVAPRSMLELRLVQLWEQLLGVQPIGVHDNFFELGGHSLTAVRLMAQIRAQLDSEVPLSALVQSPTIEALAALLEQKVTPGPEGALVLLQPEGTRPPFFCVHPVGGGTLSYMPLARTLAPEQPFYGLQAPGVDGQSTPLRSIPALAEHYLTALRVIQPEGPYMLGGWSFGGVVALEMAQQLRQQGETVALLVVLDTSVALDTPIDDDVALVAHVAEAYGVAITADALRPLAWDDQLRLLLVEAQRSGVLPAAMELAQFRPLVEVFRAHISAWQDYQAQPYAGPVVLLRAVEPLRPDSPDPTGEWQQLTADLVSIEVPGNHHTMMAEPHVQTLAMHLRALLDRVAE